MIHHKRSPLVIDLKDYTCRYTHTLGLQKMEKELKLNENQQINHIQSYYFLKGQYI